MTFNLLQDIFLPEALGLAAMVWEHARDNLLSLHLNLIFSTIFIDTNLLGVIFISSLFHVLCIFPSVHKKI